MSGIDRMRVVWSCYCVFSLGFAIALTVLARGQVYGLLVISSLTCAVYTLLEVYKRRMLFLTQEALFTAGFVTVIVLSLFYSVSCLSVLVFYNQNGVQAGKLKNLIIETVDINDCIWLNLTYYAGNALLSWLYMGCYYRMFWVDHIREIFKILKRNSQQQNLSIQACLKPVEITEEMKTNICSLCLELFNGEGTVSRLDCGHHFHRGCIQLWIQRTKSCPLCRRIVFARYKQYDDSQGDNDI